MPQSELTEGRIEHRPDMLRVCAGQGLTAQQIAAVSIGQRQRFAPLAISGQKPALEVNAPDIVGGLAMGKGRTRWRAAPAKLALHGHPSAVEQLADRARRRPLCRGGGAFQIGPDLQRPPSRMGAPPLKAALGGAVRNRLRMMQWSPRTIKQARSPFRLETCQPFVSNPTAHPDASV